MCDIYHDQRGLVIPLVEEDFIFLLNEKNELKTPRENCLKRAGGQDLIIGQNNNRDSSRQREFRFAPDCQFKLTPSVMYLYMGASIINTVSL